MKKNALILIVVLLLGLAAAAYLFRGRIDDAVYEARRPELPAAEPYAPEKDPTPPGSEGAGLGIGDEAGSRGDGQDPEPATEDRNSTAGHAVNLAVPFTPQAPHANWDMPYQEACEEASLYMVAKRLMGRGEGLIPPDEADRDLLALVEWETERFGYFEDTTAEETAVIAREYYGFENTVVLPVASMDDVRAQIEAGHAVILPAAGRKLHNPYFRGEGPLYHMLVVKGFTKDGGVITNDPGTRRGMDFVYDADLLYEAIGDWNDGAPALGEKLMVVVRS